MKTPLNIGTKIVLAEAGTSKETEFTITELIGAGASCIVYTAVHKDGEGNKYSVRLKEFYPNGMDIKRNGTALVISDYDKFSQLLAYFTSGYQKQLEFRQNPAQMNSISNIQGVYTGNNTKYIAMSCNAGACLTAEDDYTFTEIMRIICAVTKQIAAFHESDYLYLDLKPNNIFLYPETLDMVMLFDFDSVISKENVRKYSEWLSYTEEWSAPELSGNRLNKIDERADIYSIGALLLFLLFKRKPSLSDKRRWASWDKDIANSILAAESPENIRLVTDILKKTLCTSTDSRFRSCYDILDIVEPYLESLLAPKPYLKTSLPIGNNFFCGRDEEIADIHDKLQNGTSFLMLHGIGGIGKSELAKHYAAGHSADYDAAVFVRFNKDIMHTVVLDTNFPVVNCKRSEEEKDEEYFQRKMQILQDICTPRHLIILDNFDTEDCDNLDILTKLNCKILVTSRVDYSDVFEQIDVGVLSDEGDLFNIIDHYYKEEISIDEVPIVWDMINAVQGHTMAIELIAKHMQMMKISPAEMQSLLAENGIAAGDKGRVRNFKDGHLKSETAYAHIAALFNIFGLSDDMKQVLRYSALLGPYAVDIDTYLDFVNLSDEEIIAQDSLLKCGWLQITENNEECYLTIHPLICDVLCNELKPDIEHCEEFILNAADIAESIGGFEYENRKLRIQCLDHISYNIRGNSTAVIWMLYYMTTMYMHEADLQSAKWCNNRILEIIYSMGVEKEFSTAVLNSYLSLQNIDSLFGIDDTKEYYAEKIREMDTSLALEYLSEIKCDEALANNDYDTALEYSQHRLRIALETGDKESISRAYNQLGGVEKNFFHFNEADNYYRKASKYIDGYISEILKKGDKSYAKIADYYQYAGDIRNSCKDYSGAISDYQKAIYFFDLEYGENNDQSGVVCTCLAEIYAKTGDREKLLESQEKAVRAYERVYGRAHIETAGLYKEFYYAYMEFWEDNNDCDALKKAAEVAEILIELYTELDGENSISAAYFYMNFSKISRMLNDKKNCSEYMENALRIYDSVLDSDDEYWIYVHSDAAENYMYLEDMNSARSELEKGLALSKRLGDEFMTDYFNNELDKLNT